MFLEIILFIILLIFLRTLSVIFDTQQATNSTTTTTTTTTAKKRRDAVRTLICLGSGGHTTEMMELIKQMNSLKYSPRFYVIANSDTTSESKVYEYEKSGNDENFSISKISRSRNVHQSYISSIFTTLNSIVKCIPLVYRIKPDLILCNGPGTCVPICLIALLLKICFLNQKCKIVFVESYCRVKTLSLTGRILIWFVDVFVVHWPDLLSVSPKIQYFGKLF